MRQCFGALLCVCVVGARSRPAAADAVTEDAALAIAIEMYVDPVLAVRVSDLDPSRYETYVRELFRGTAPETPIVVEGTGTRRASHVFVIDFAPAEQRGMVRVTVSVKLGRGVTRRMELARVATTTVASGDGAAFETFLRQQVARVVALYRLRDGGVPDAAQGRTGDRAMPVAELGMTLAVDSRVRGPTADAVSSAVRTTLATALPGVTLVGPFVSAQEAGTERPMLAVEIVRLDGDAGDTSAGGERNRVRVTLTDRERGALVRADEVYDDGDAERALRFLRETIRTVAGKLLEDPLLFPIASSSEDSADSLNAPIDREWEDDPIAALPADTPTTPDAQTGAQVVTTTPRWRRIVRISEVTVAGLGVAAIGFGAWQGLAARSTASEYRNARIQLDAEDAKQRSEMYAKRANTLFALGAATVVLGGTSIALDLSGVYDRWSGRGASASTVRILPTSRGIVGAWSIVIP